MRQNPTSESKSVLDISNDLIAACPLPHLFSEKHLCADNFFNSLCFLFTGVRSPQKRKMNLGSANGSRAGSGVSRLAMMQVIFPQSFLNFSKTFFTAERNFIQLPSTNFSVVSQSSKSVIWHHIRMNEWRKSPSFSLWLWWWSFGCQPTVYLDGFEPSTYFILCSLLLTLFLYRHERFTMLHF